MIGRSNIVAPLVLLVASICSSAGAVSCYQCNYTSIDPTTLTCSDRFNATTAGQCSASLCTWKIASYTSSSTPSLSLIFRDCVNDANYTYNSNCDQNAMMSNGTTMPNYTTVFKYGDSCCYTTGTQDDKQKGNQYNITVCFCQKDFCNGDTSPVVAPSTTTYKPTNAMPLMKPSLCISWVFAVSTVLWMVQRSCI